jgi:hypothetical protein
VGVPAAEGVTVIAELADKLSNTVPVILGVRVTILGVDETVELAAWLPDTVILIDLVAVVELLSLLLCDKDGVGVTVPSAEVVIDKLSNTVPVTL